MKHKKFSKKSKAPKSPKVQKSVEGLVRFHPRGHAFLETEGNTGPSILINPAETGSLMAKDRVRCQLSLRPQGWFASDVQVVSRATTHVVGRLVQMQKHLVFELSDKNQPALHFRFQERKGGSWHLLRETTLFKAQILRYPGQDSYGLVQLEEILGREGALATEIALILANANIATEFPKAVLEAAAKFNENPEEADFSDRKDLQKLAFCTIDGETAKDFDDAVFAAKTKEGYRIRVAIADVGHYVTPGSVIDKEALARGSSLYYPGSCIPMLPEALSNGLCSLKPNVPRLVFVADFAINQTGEVTSRSFYKAVIKSHSRLTYTFVQTFWSETASKEAVQKMPAALKTSLNHLLAASRILRKRREEKGAIDFDAVESHVALNSVGEPVDIRPSERLESNRVIEDLMIAANEAVAGYLFSRELKTMYRVHETPDIDKFNSFLDLVERLQILSVQAAREFRRALNVKSASTLLKTIRSHEAKDALESLFLRSMKQARYSADNIGHFGLASDAYLHFTSPIRRYPDLVVHRQLIDVLTKGSSKNKRPPLILDENLAVLADALSIRERQIVDVERQINALFSVWFMADKVGEVDDGLVVGCAEFGMFVRLKRFHVEGMVHVAQMGADYFHYDQKQLRLVGAASGHSYGVGDSVRVRVESVNVQKRFIDLSLVTELRSTKKEKNRSAFPRDEKGSKKRSEKRRFR